MRTLYTEKIQRHPSAPLAWGSTGNAALGIHKFGKWLKQHDWPPPDWDTFQAEATRKVAEINGEQREIWKLAGVAEDTDHLFGVLLIGWSGNEPLILEIDDKGIPNIVEKMPPFHAIGSGGVHANLIHLAYAKIGVRLQSPVKLFHAILSIASRRTSMRSARTHFESHRARR